MANESHKIDINTSQIHHDLTVLMKASQEAGYTFMVYLISMVLEELINIEKGKPTKH